MTVKIMVGDCRAVLRSLPAESVHCVVTSPPYWGLRDYGTGTWEGGDPACEHRSPTMREGRNEDRDKLDGSASTNSAQLLLAHRSACGKCGAVKVDRQLGIEPTLGEHLAAMVAVFDEVWRVLRKDGTLWLNYGDCYATTPNGRSAAQYKADGTDDRTFRDKPFSTVGPLYDPEGGAKGGGARGQNKGNGLPPNGRIVAGGFLKPKDLCMVPNRIAIALQDRGWWVRSEIIWHKPNPMPESIKDRPGTSHEKIWLLTKAERYFYDDAAVRQPITDSSLERLGQASLPDQEGSARANGGSRAHRPMKAVRFGGDKGGGDFGASARTKSGNEWRPRATPPRHADYENSDRSGLNDVGRGQRNLRNVWTIPTAAFAEAHFATFPPALVEPCIKAGTSEHGVCNACGAPWVRETERSRTRDGEPLDGDWGATKDQKIGPSGVGHWRDKTDVTTTGWAPSCKCEQTYPLSRAVVLDPFGGSGTVGMVASGHGRDAILAELNPAYAELAAKRIGLFASVTPVDPYADGWPDAEANSRGCYDVAIAALRDRKP